jgi:sulfur carrier protein
MGRAPKKGVDMDVIINGEPEQVADGLSISQLLTAKGVEKPDMVAVELNSNMIRRSEYDTVTVGPNDRIEFLYFMGGGAA